MSRDIKFLLIVLVGLGIIGVLYHYNQRQNSIEESFNNPDSSRPCTKGRVFKYLTAITFIIFNFVWGLMCSFHGLQVLPPLHHK